MEWPAHLPIVGGGGGGGGGCDTYNVDLRKFQFS